MRPLALLLLLVASQALALDFSKRCDNGLEPNETCGAYGYVVTDASTTQPFAAGLIGRAFIYPSYRDRISWGLVTEVFAMPGANTAMVGGELSVVSLNNDNAHVLWGLDLVFKNRFDGVPSVGSVGRNQYNENSRAINISAQPRSLAGEYSGWQTGIHFDLHSLDRTASKPYAALIDFSDITDSEPWMMVWGNAVKYGMKFSVANERVEYWRDITMSPKLVGVVNMRAAAWP